MRVMQISKPGAPFELVERPIPQPGPGEVRVKVQSCGVCHSDSLVKEGHWPRLTYPRIPGHEVIGVIDAVGAAVPNWKPGDRVGIGWYADHCGYCDPCRRGKLTMCRNGKITGIHVDGGYAEFMLASFHALAAIPDAVSPLDGGPLLCAGVTTFNAMRNAGAQSGDTVAVLGIGGLGHLGIQYANKMGFRTIAIARGADKAPLARQLGAHIYIDSQKEPVAAALQKLGGAKLILATVTSGKAMSEAVGGLGVDGKLLVVGAPADPLTVSAFPLISNRCGLQGWASGASIDSEDTLNFSAANNIKAMIESFPLDRVAEAYDRMMSGNARFRVVITM